MMHSRFCGGCIDVITQQNVQQYLQHCCDYSCTTWVRVIKELRKIHIVPDAPVTIQSFPSRKIMLGDIDESGFLKGSKLKVRPMRTQTTYQ